MKTTVSSTNILLEHNDRSLIVESYGDHVVEHYRVVDELNGETLEVGFVSLEGAVYRAKEILYGDR